MCSSKIHDLEENMFDLIVLDCMYEYDKIIRIECDTFYGNT